MVEDKSTGYCQSDTILSISDKFVEYGIESLSITFTYERKGIMSRESKKNLKRGKETEEKETKQIRAVNRISLAGVIIAGIIFLAASIAAIPTIGYHLACFSAFMVVFIETYEWLIVIYKKKAEKAAFHRDKQKYQKIYNHLKNFKGMPFLLVFVAIVVSVSVVSFAGKYWGEYTDIICAVTILLNVLSLYFRIR